MFEKLLEQLIAFMQAFLQEIKDWLDQNTGEGQVRDKVLNLLYSFDSWLHNFIDEVKAWEPPPPEQPQK